MAHMTFVTILTLRFYVFMRIIVQVDTLLSDLKHYQALSEGHVVSDAVRCVQCGICSYNCPIGIDVRSHAWRGLPIDDSHCLTCGECITRCPRCTLRFERTHLFP
jgi:ferredoxin